MKEQILNSLKLKYKNLGLGEKILDGIASMLALTTTEESQIEASVDGVKDLLVSFQSDADKRVTDAVTKAVKPVKTVKKEEGAANDAGPVKKEEEDKIPKWALEMSAKLDKLEHGKEIDLRKQALEKTLKGASPAFKTKILKDFGRMAFESDEDFNNYVEETTKDAAEFTKENMRAFGRPISGTVNSKVEASQKEVDDIVDNIMYKN